MRIDKFLVRNYRSILDSDKVALVPGMTTVLGKNESGKRHTLRALDSFSQD